MIRVAIGLGADQFRLSKAAAAHGTRRGGGVHVDAARAACHVEVGAVGHEARSPNGCGDLHHTMIASTRRRDTAHKHKRLPRSVLCTQNDERPCPFTGSASFRGLLPDVSIVS